MLPENVSSKTYFFKDVFYRKCLILDFQLSIITCSAIRKFDRICMKCLIPTWAVSAKAYKK